MDVFSLMNAGIRGLTPYQPGKPMSELMRELPLKKVVKLASNENALGPSPLAIDAASRGLQETNLYPDGASFELKQALAQRHCVAPSQLILGNGSDEIFNLLLGCFVSTAHEVIVSEYGFSAYSIAVKTVSARLVIVPAIDFGADLAAIQRVITDKTRVIFLANPNNPTGTWHAKNDLIAFLQRIPQTVLVLVDEAYFEYMSDPRYASAMKCVKDFPNLIVTRTFSKAYGLAGFRVGYGVCSTEMAQVLNRIRLPFNVNSLGQLAAVAALKDKEHLTNTLRMTQQGRQQLTQGFEKMGLGYLPAFGNFVTVDVEQNGDTIYQRLLQEGVIVRPLLPYNMPSYLRITIGLEEENEFMLNALKKVIK